MRAAVVGLGLIGGSAALALEARGYDHDAEARALARRRGIDVADSLSEAVRGAEIVLLAVPTAETPDLLLRAAAAAPNALLTDTASLKRSVVAAARALPPAARFVAGHPMAGSTATGVGGAGADLFRSRPWLVVPTERSDSQSVEAVQGLARRMGARPVVIDAERHDALMTWVSHLPHAVASALARAVSSEAGSNLGEFAGPGLLDTTRIAGTPASLALELALADPQALAGAIEAVRRELAQLADSITRGDAEKLRAAFEQTAKARRASEKPEAP
jgi:prephenate dehydrogenase